MRPARALTLAAALVVGAATAITFGITSAAPSAPVPAATALPAYDHVVIALFENKNYPDVASGSSAPYLQKLAAQGALFSQSFGVTHPSQPNYIALFSGDQQGVTGDSCPNSFGNKPNLARQLLDKGRTFASYAEDLPSTGDQSCTRGNYARKHAPWTNFSNVPTTLQHPYTDFPTDFTKLPTVSFVIPNMCNDMHDCSIRTGDNWSKSHLDAYAQWAKTHNSLLITSFDEDNFTSVNQIYTSFVGQRVVPGSYAEQVDHYTVLRTVEAMYGLTPLGHAAERTPVTDVFSG